MKIKTKAWFLVVLVPFFVVSVHSCSRESDNLDYSPQTFAYKVGSVWYTGGLTHAWYYDTAKAFRAELYGNPVTVNYLFIEVTGANYLATAVYPVGYDSITNTNITLRFFTDASHPYTSTSGNLTITEFDTISRRLTGTFQFTGKYLNDTRQITNGSFERLSYVKQ